MSTIELARRSRIELTSRIEVVLEKVTISPLILRLAEIVIGRYMKLTPLLEGQTTVIAESRRSRSDNFIHLGFE